MRRTLLVFLGGGLGAALRAVLIAGFATGDRAVPWTVLLINAAGAFALGVVYVLADECGLLRTGTRLFVAVGFLGGFTTFSTFGWGAVALAAGGSGATAGVYVAASVVAGVVAVMLGMAAAHEAVGLLERTALALLQRLNRRGRRRHGDIHVDLGSIEAEDRRSGLQGEARGQQSA